jgi:hypothetical protein
MGFSYAQIKFVVISHLKQIYSKITPAINLQDNLKRNSVMFSSRNRLKEASEDLRVLQNKFIWNQKFLLVPQSDQLITLSFCWIKKKCCCWDFKRDYFSDATRRVLFGKSPNMERTLHKIRA